MPSLIGCCDIYAAPSRLEGFGMPQVEANACGKPVLGINAMAMRETLVHGSTAFLAGVAQEIVIRETLVGEESGFEEGHRVVFDTPRTVGYRADVHDIAEYLLELMKNPDLRKRMGAAGRRRVVECYDYRVVAQKLLRILTDRLGLS
jgi:starch synthase